MKCNEISTVFSQHQITAKSLHIQQLNTVLGAVETSHSFVACALVKAAPQIQDHFIQFLPTYTTRIFFKIGGYEVNYFWNHIMGSFSNFN